MVMCWRGYTLSFLLSMHSMLIINAYFKWLALLAVMVLCLYCNLSKMYNQCMVECSFILNIVQK